MSRTTHTDDDADLFEGLTSVILAIEADTLTCKRTCTVVYLLIPPPPPFINEVLARPHNSQFCSSPARFRGKQPQNFIQHPASRSHSQFGKVIAKESRAEPLREAVVPPMAAARGQVFFSAPTQALR